MWSPSHSLHPEPLPSKGTLSLLSMDTGCDQSSICSSSQRRTRGKKKSSFVTQCFIFQKTSLRCALETLLLGISFFSQAAYLSALVLDMILRAYLPSDQNFFPTCFFIKIIRAWNQLLFFLLLTIFAIFIKSKQHISMSFLRLSACLLICL